jgi:hypothetical protein
MNNTEFNIDLNLIPTTFDAIHVYLAATIFALALTVIILLFLLVLGLLRQAKITKATHSTDNKEQTISTSIPKREREPEIKVIEKIVEVERIVEVEKIVQLPAPKPITLKVPSSDAALQLLNLLQKEARFIDFIKEDISAHSDSDIGAAARVMLTGCAKTINQHFDISAVRSEEEGSSVTLEAGFNAAEVRLTGNIVGKAPFKGTLIHKGWKVTGIKLPKLTAEHQTEIIAAAQVEL